jgi:hypothetical protein
MEHCPSTRRSAGEGRVPHPEQESAPYPDHRVEQADLELSCFRFRIQRDWHVTMLGELPPDDIDRQIERMLARGDPVTLPADIVGVLSGRRRAVIQLGPLG